MTGGFRNFELPLPSLKKGKVEKKFPPYLFVISTLPNFISTAWIFSPLEIAF